MWGLLALILVVALMGGCAVVFGSGSASAQVDRKLEVASDNDVKAASTKEVKK